MFTGWLEVYDLLTQDGYNVAVVQNPTLSLEGDVAATRQAIDAQDGPVVLVGHSYGGAVISEAGTHPDVAALVYIAAFAPDEGESVNTLIADPPPDAPVPPILPPKDGFLFLDREKFPASFAGGVPAEQAAFMADSQVPWGVGALSGLGLRYLVDTYCLGVKNALGPQVMNDRDVPPERHHPRPTTQPARGSPPRISAGRMT